MRLDLGAEHIEYGQVERRRDHFNVGFADLVAARCLGLGDDYAFNRDHRFVGDVRGLT